MLWWRTRDKRATCHIRVKCYQKKTLSQISPLLYILMVITYSKIPAFHFPSKSLSVGLCEAQLVSYVIKIKLRS